MSTPSSAPIATSPRSASAGVVRSCIRPACGRRATTTMRFDYARRTVMLDPLGPEARPGEYDLCLHHAARSGPPTGWTLRDRAPSPESAVESAPPVGPDRGKGVDRLAAALSAVRRVVSEDAPDAAPARTDRSAAPGPAIAATADMGGAARLDVLLRPSEEPAPEARPEPQPLRLAPDPTTTVWCADLLGAQHA